MTAIWREGDRVELHGTGWWDGHTGRVASWPDSTQLSGWIPVAIDGQVGVHAFKNHELTRISDGSGE